MPSSVSFFAALIVFPIDLEKTDEISTLMLGAPPPLAFDFTEAFFGIYLEPPTGVCYCKFSSLGALSKKPST